MSRLRSDVEELPEWFTSGVGELGAEFLEGGVEPGSLSEQVHHEAEVPAIEGCPECDEVRVDVSAQVTGHLGVGDVVVGEHIAQQRR